MSGDVAIRVEGLGKKYLIGHQTKRERNVTLRDVLMRGGRNSLRRVADLARGRAIVSGNTVEEFWALRHVSFEVKRGEVMGIFGRNGAGKSTLLKILSRITEPSEGRATIHGRVASLLEIGTGFHTELTGRENIYLNGAILGMTQAEIRRKFDEIVSFAEVEKFLDTPVKRYSSGMYVRLAFAVAAHLEPEILVVDEVLAVGDAEFQKKCIGKMSAVAGAGRTVLIVSHNLHSVSNLCSRGIVLADGELLEDSTIDRAIGVYTTRAMRPASSAHHILYENANSDGKSEGCVIRVEMLSGELTPKAAVSSCDAVVFRIWIRCQAAIPQSSVILSIRAPTGATLAKFETDPRQIQPMKRLGDHFVDCHIPSFPFMPGQYLVSVGLTQYGIAFDWRVDAVALTVREGVDRQVSMVGYSEGAVIVGHQWTMSAQPVLAPTDVL